MTKLSIVAAITTIFVCITSVWAESQRSCSVTCYEKTPDCYVTKDSKGCLTISNEKPKKNSNGDLMCMIPGCETETKY